MTLPSQRKVIVFWGTFCPIKEPFLKQLSVVDAEVGTDSHLVSPMIVERDPDMDASVWINLILLTN